LGRSGDRRRRRRNQRSPEKKASPWVFFFAKFKSPPFDRPFFSWTLISLLKRSRQIAFKWDLTAMRLMARTLASCCAALDHAVGPSDPGPLITIMWLRSTQRTLRLFSRPHRIFWRWLLFFGWPTDWAWVSWTQGAFCTPLFLLPCLFCTPPPEMI
jgi:hypothetical protein